MTVHPRTTVNSEIARNGWSEGGQAPPPSTADAGAWHHRLVAYHDEYSQPAPHGVSLLRRGVLTGLGDLEHSGLVSGCQVTVSDPAGNQVASAVGFWVFDGRLYGKVAEAHPFDLVDGDGAALADGESYWAAITLGAGSVLLTKGSKAITPQKPTVAASEPFQRWIRVEVEPLGVPR